MRVETVGQASTFCVPTALAFLTGFSRQAVVIGLRDKIRATNYNGGYQHSDYIRYLKTLPKNILELGEMRKGPTLVEHLPAGTFLVSGQISGSDKGHCFIAFNGLIFDNMVVGKKPDGYYLCWKYYPVIHSQMPSVIRKMHEKMALAA